MAITIKPGTTTKPPETPDTTPTDQSTPSTVQSIAPKKVITPTKGESAAIIAAIAKSKGEKVVVRGSATPDVGRIPTGIFEFDLYTGGGFPRGRLSLPYGVESSGKTNLALKAAAYVQQYDPPECNKVVFVNLEQTFDPKWAAKVAGVDNDELILVNPGYGEEAADIIDGLVRASDVSLLIVDSIAVLTAAQEADKSTEKADMGTSPMLVKRICNKLALAFSAESKRGHFPAVIFLNQTRYKLGVMYGDPETMPGGQTMKFMSSLTIRMSGKNIIDKGINPELPAFKQTSLTIKKAKVPILSTSFEYSMAMLNTESVPIGETNSWNTVLGHMKDLGVLTKLAKGWMLFGQTMPTLVPFQEAYLYDTTFRNKCQQEVIKHLASPDKKTLVEASGYAAK